MGPLISGKCRLVNYYSIWPDIRYHVYIIRYLVDSAWFDGPLHLVRKARSFEPVLDDALRNDMADAYVAMRIWDSKI